MGQLAQAYTGLNRFEEAAEIYLKLISMNPDNFTAFLNLGAVLFEAGKTEKAMKYTIRARDLKPDSPVPEYNIGLFLLCRGEAEKAVNAYKRALNNDRERRYTAFALEELAKSRARIKNESDFTRTEKLLQEEFDQK
jgi:tetratricopeptide (TPR) repeat protein